MADYDERTINTYDTYGQDTFAEASFSESGPSPNGSKTFHTMVKDRKMTPRIEESFLSPNY